MDLFCEDTPTEVYVLDGKTVYVKREDLFGRWPAPPLAKLRGMRRVLRKLFENGTRIVGCWDTRVSKLGQGLAACCTEFPGMKAIVSYPTRKGDKIPDAIEMAAKLGAEIYPVPGGRIRICYARASEFVNDLGGVMLPFGLNCPEAVEGVKDQAELVPSRLLKGGTVVVSCGSGVTLAGLVAGLNPLPRRLVGISSGRSLENIRACVKKHVGLLPRCLELHEAEVPYSEVSSFPSPFPSHPNYDRKAWKFLAENLKRYRDPLLFWNIGA